jgi:hypothetical protein
LPLGHHRMQANEQEEPCRRVEAAERGKCKLQGPLPFRIGDSNWSRRTWAAAADTMQNQGCMTSMAWLPWAIAAQPVGCPAALKGVFCTPVSAPVEGFRVKPDTVLPRKFEV